MRCPTTVPLAPLLLAASLLSLSSTATAIQLKDELNAGWTFGLMPRDTSSENLQIFTGALGGAEADPPDFATAAGRSCDNQKNACANIANSGGGSFTVGDCDSQNSETPSPFVARIFLLGIDMFLSIQAC
ncbi:hypothetical protein HOO65_090249 [Ceratocystis lukuohia]|uniref:Uncharacterized protein n=1 Tax=Ceratocystis lukuohia TaxID=2019550 RepID=A0ABR4M9K7_9PEZI